MFIINKQPNRDFPGGLKKEKKKKRNKKKRNKKTGVRSRKSWGGGKKYFCGLKKIKIKRNWKCLLGDLVVLHWRDGEMGERNGGRMRIKLLKGDFLRFLRFC